MQVTASRVLGEVVQQELIPIHIFISSCLTTIFKQLESKDPGQPHPPSPSPSPRLDLALALALALAH